MARPTDLSDDLALQLAGMLEQGSTITDACAIVGVGESTYHRWMDRGEKGEGPFEEFRELILAARARGRQALVEKIALAASSDWRAAAWILERSDPDNWGRRDKLELAGKVEVNAESRRAELASILVALRIRAGGEADRGADCEGLAGRPGGSEHGRQAIEPPASSAP